MNNVVFKKCYQSAKKWYQKNRRLPTTLELLRLCRKLFNLFFKKIKKNFKNLFYSGFNPPAQIDRYEAWLEVNQWNSRRELLLKNNLEQLPEHPLLSVIMPVYNPPLNYLIKAIQSVFDQVYPAWELCIADDASTDETIKVFITALAQKDPRIHLSFCKVNGHISKTTNTAASMAQGDFLIFLDQDDELSPDALAEVALYLSKHNATDLIYSDDDKIDENNHRFDPQFKPDWSPMLLLSYQYMGHLLGIRKQLFDKINGTRIGYEGSQDYDLILRATEHTQLIGHIPKILYHWRAIPGSTAFAGTEKHYSIEAGRRAVEDACHRRKIMTSVHQPKWAENIKSGIYAHVFPDTGPKVTIIIPTKNHYVVLKKCIDSLMVTTYKNFDICVVNNDSDDPKILSYFEKNLNLFKTIHISTKDKKFSFSYINNHAAKEIKSELILFLNNDTEVINPRWLSQMVGYLSISGIGAVGAKLIFPNQHIQHAGIIHGLYGGLAGPAFKLMPGSNDGYLNYAAVARNYSAVTAACLLTSRKLFLELGGFDETEFNVAYNDVDLCYRMLAHGYQVVFCPEAALYHHEGYSRGLHDNPKETAAFKHKYKYFKDRYYNPNLSLDNERFEIAAKTVFSFPLPNPIKAVMYSHNLNWEGAPNSQYELTKFLKNIKIIDPIVYSPLDGPLRSHYENIGVKVKIFDSPLKDIHCFADYERALNQLGDHILNDEAQLVYANTLDAFYTIAAAKLKGLPSIWNIRESESWKNYFSHFGEKIEKHALSCFSYPYKIIFVANNTRSRFEALNSKHNFTTIHNGLDRDRFFNAINKWSRQSARKQLNLSDKDVMVFLPGTVCKRKGQLDLIKAVDKIDKQHDISLHYYIVGNRPSAYSDELQKAVKNLSASKASSVKILPETSDLGLYYQAADIFVCCSRIESYPRVILEAMSACLPIITTPVFGITEQVQENINALFYHPGDINKLAQQLKHLYESAELRTKFSINSQHIMNILTDYDTMGLMYGEIFKEAWLSGPRGN